MSDVKFDELQKGDKLLFARVLPHIGYYELIEVKMVTVNKEQGYCTGAAQDKTKHTYLFNSKRHAETVLFKKRAEALQYLEDKRIENKDVHVAQE